MNQADRQDRGVIVGACTDCDLLGLYSEDHLPVTMSVAALLGPVYPSHSRNLLKVE